MTEDRAARHPRPPRVPAQVEPYVEALGLDLAVQFILHFGGAELYIRRTLDMTSELATLVGPDGVAALARRAHRKRITAGLPLG
jgi:hypothetical protein